MPRQWLHFAPWAWRPFRQHPSETRGKEVGVPVIPATIHFPCEVEEMNIKSCRARQLSLALWSFLVVSALLSLGYGLGSMVALLRSDSWSAMLSPVWLVMFLVQVTMLVVSCVQLRRRGLMRRSEAMELLVPVPISVIAAVLGWALLMPYYDRETLGAYFARHPSGMFIAYTLLIQVPVAWSVATVLLCFVMKITFYELKARQKIGETEETGEKAPVIGDG